LRPATRERRFKALEGHVKGATFDRHVHHRDVMIAAPSFRRETAPPSSLQDDADGTLSHVAPDAPFLVRVLVAVVAIGLVAIFRERSLVRSAVAGRLSQPPPFPIGRFRRARSWTGSASADWNIFLINALGIDSSLRDRLSRRVLDRLLVSRANLCRRGVRPLRENGECLAARGARADLHVCGSLGHLVEVALGLTLVFFIVFFNRPITACAKSAPPCSPPSYARMS